MNPSLHFRNNTPRMYSLSSSSIGECTFQNKFITAFIMLNRGCLYVFIMLFMRISSESHCYINSLGSMTAIEQCHPYPVSFHQSTLQIISTPNHPMGAIPNNYLKPFCPKRGCINSRRPKTVLGRNYRMWVN